MDIERGRLIEILVSVSAVGLFIILLIGIGTLYSDDQLTPEGGMVLVGAIVAFILMMAIVGIGLAYVLNDEDQEESA